MSKKNKNKYDSQQLRILIYCCELLVCLISLFPLVWIFISSLKSDPLAEPGFTLPSAPTVKGYITVFKDIGIGRYFFNSMTVAALSVLISITAISMSAYVIARMKFRGNKLITTLLYSTLFIPPTALTFPIFNLVNRLGIYDTHIALIGVYSCLGIAMSFFVIKNYFSIIPKELEEAALIDGCSYSQIFIRVMLPIAVPAISTAGILAFLNNWNEYYWASLLLINRKLLTIPALLSQFTTAFTTNYNGLFSAIVVIVIPPIMLYISLSGFFVKAMSGGAVKG